MFTFVKLLLVCNFVCFGAQAFAGKEGGNGGDSDALDFAIAGQKVVSALKILKQSDFPEFKISDYENVVDAATISMVSKALYKNNIEVNALNFPDEKLIQANRGRWRGPLKNVKARLGLVFHEYLGIVLGITGKLPAINDDNYHITTRFLSKVNLNDFISIIPQWSCSASCLVQGKENGWRLTGNFWEMAVISDGSTAGDSFRELMRACVEAIDRVYADGGKHTDSPFGPFWKYHQLEGLITRVTSIDENGTPKTWDNANTQNACVKNY